MTLLSSVSINLEYLPQLSCHLLLSECFVSTFFSHLKHVLYLDVNLLFINTWEFCKVIGFIITFSHVYMMHFSLTAFFILFILLLGISDTVEVSYSHETHTAPSDIGWEWIRVWPLTPLHLSSGKVNYSSLWFSFLADNCKVSPASFRFSSSALSTGQNEAVTINTSYME